MTFRADDRGASTTVTHALAIGISSLLVLTLLLGLGGFLDGQEKNAADRQLQTVGERVTTELSKAERYANDASGLSNPITFQVSHPERVAGQSYRIKLEQPGGTGATIKVQLLSDRSQNVPPIQFEPMHSETRIEGGQQTVDGGDFTITVGWDGSEYVVRLEG